MECINDFYLHNFRFRSCKEFDDSLLAKGTVIYEVIKIENGIPIFLEDHLNRLFDSADISGLNINESYCDIETLIDELIKKNKVTEGKIKLIIRFDDLKGNSEKDLLIYFTPYLFPNNEEYEGGVEVGLCNAVRLNPNVKVYNTEARKKANNRIVEEKLYEVLLMNKDGFVTEGSRSNIFFIQNEKVITPPVYDVLNGITRKHLINICKQNSIDLTEDRIHYSDLSNVDCAFLSGTSIKVLPIKSIGNKPFDTKNKILRKIMELYDLAIFAYLNSKINLTS